MSYKDNETNKGKRWSTEEIDDLIKELNEKVGQEPWEVLVDEDTPRYFGELKEKYSEAITNAFTISNKSERGEAINAVRESIREEYTDLDELQQGKVFSASKKLESERL